MANRYWVGGSGNWTDSSHWSATSGGAGGVSVPNSSDNVTIDANSSGSNLSISWNGTDATCAIFDSRTFPYTLDLKYLAGAGSFISLRAATTIYAHNVVSSGTYAVSFDSTLGSQTGLYQTGSLDGNARIGSNMSLFTTFIGSALLNQQGKFSSNGNTLDLNTFGASSNSGQTIDITNSIVQTSSFTLANSSTSLVSTNSTIILQGSSTKYVTLSSSQQLNVLIDEDDSDVINLTGNLSVRKLVLKGKSGRTIVKPSSGTTPIGITILDTNQLVAASNLDLRNIQITGSGTYYAGSGSVTSGSTSGWVLSDAPEVETLVDNFTGGTINTTRWTVNGSGLSQASNELLFTGISGVRTASLISNSQYLAEGSSVRFKANVGVGTLTVMLANAYLQYGVTNGRNIPNIYLYLSPTDGRFYLNAETNYTSATFTNAYSYYQIREASGSIYLDGSNDGITYTNVKTVVASSYGLDTTQLIARPIFNFYSDSPGSITVDDLNVLIAAAADFSYTPSSGFNPLTVNFTDLSNFAPTSWLWNFGDGTTSTVQNPSKTYTTIGTYSVQLTSSTTGITQSITKTNIITVNPNVFTRSISGTLTLGGSVARVLNAYRSISGTLVFGGGVRAVVLTEVEAIQDKTFLYKVYDEDGSYIEVWKDVISELNYTNEINSIGSTTNVELARNSDSLGVSTSPLLTESGLDILTESDQPILVNTESRNQIGSGSSVDYNNRVDIYAYYGSIEPLQTEDLLDILTENDEQILADVGSPNGRIVFTGFISDINSRYGNSETTLVQLTSYGWDLDQFPITTAYNNDVTTVSFNSVDPSNIPITAIDRFVQRSNLEELTYTTRADNSIALTGTVVSYTFKANTYKDVLDKTVELMPSNWYYRVGLGDNVVYFSERATVPHHLFYLGKHIKAEDLKGSILDATNHVLYTGGGDPALYVQTKEALAPRTRRRLKIMSDSRVTSQTSAEIISEGIIEQSNKIQYRTTVEILTKQYDIESISVGEVVGFRNFGNYVDDLTMQIVGLSYSPDVVQLQLETKPPTINKRLEDIRRNLTVSDNEYVPTTPA